MPLKKRIFAFIFVNNIVYLHKITNEKIRFIWQKNRAVKDFRIQSFLCATIWTKKGKHPEQQTVKRCVNGINKSNGIDRVDNEIGYIYENCVCCCKVCNTMKMNLSVYEFLNHISKIFKYNNNVTN